MYFVSLSNLLSCLSFVLTVDLSTWKEKIVDDLSNVAASSHSEPDYHSEDPDSSFVQHEQYKDGILTIGCCGR